MEDSKSCCSITEGNRSPLKRVTNQPTNQHIIVVIIHIMISACNIKLLSGLLFLWLLVLPATYYYNDQTRQTVWHTDWWWIGVRDGHRQTDKMNELNWTKTEPNRTAVHYNILHQVVVVAVWCLIPLWLEQQKKKKKKKVFEMKPICCCRCYCCCSCQNFCNCQRHWI